MFDHRDLAALHARSTAMQEWIKQRTYSPALEKELRRFSSWETAELILKIDPSMLRGALAANPALPRGEGGEDGRQRWFDLEEINALRRSLDAAGRDLLPHRPAGKRAVRAAIANFKGGAGKSTVALHFAHAAALDGYRVLAVDFDPQATLSHAMGVDDVEEERTVWGVMARDLVRETRAMNSASEGARSGLRPRARALPAAIERLELEALGPADFMRATSWPTIDLVPSCANAAFVEFASAQYRHANPEWSFFAAVSRFLDEIPDDVYDLILFDCPPAIGYQSMNAVFAADMLTIPSGPGYWEYDSTTSFIGQLSEALEDLAAGFGETFPAGKVELPKAFASLRFLLTRYEPKNPLHQAMRDAFGKAFGQHVCEHPIELTRAVEQSGRFLCSIYEIDYRTMTRDTWKRARQSFDRAYDEFRAEVAATWATLPESEEGARE